MKKKYVNPSVVVYDVNIEGLMNPVSSIVNSNGEIQNGVKDDNRDDFEAGGKQNFNPWTTWDDDDE